MRKTLKVLAMVAAIVLFVMLCMYFSLAAYYRNGFAYGTYINGIYCTGKTVEEVVDALNAKVDSDNEKISVIVDDKLYSIDQETIEFRFDYAPAVKSFLDEQNPYLWGYNLITAKSNGIMNPGGVYDVDKLADVVQNINLEADDNLHNVEIRIDDTDVILYDGKKSIIDGDKVFNQISEELTDGNIRITIQDCYQVPNYSDEDKSLMDRYTEISSFAENNIAFTLIDSEYVLSPSDKCGLLVCSDDAIPALLDNGEIGFTKESVLDGVTHIFENINTYHNHTFKTHDGRYVYLDEGTFGIEYDIKKTAAELYRELTNGKSDIVIEPAVLHNESYNGEYNVGDTYIEVSLDEQHLYYYKDGELVLDTDVVTGKKGRSDTPQMVSYVYYKQKNRTLVGPTYRSFVKYWMAIYKHIGIHDASWRDEFGGELYDGGGSHGCINTPTQQVSRLYEMVEEGTPVVVYSYEESHITVS